LKAQLWDPLIEFLFPSWQSRKEPQVTTVSLKDQISAVIDDERTQWEAIVAEIDPDRMEEPGLCGYWSFRDLTAHLYAWRDGGTNLLEAVVKGEPEPSHPWPAELQTDDEINDWFYQRDKHKSLDIVLRDYSDTFPRLKTAVTALPDWILTDPNYFAWMGGQSVASSMLDRSWFEHLHIEHEPQIREWLDGE
jgi:hypothetical protein